MSYSFFNTKNEEVFVFESEELDKVMAWRLDALERMGFEPTVALRLAIDKTIELHAIEKALADGCSLATAVKIFS